MRENLSKVPTLQLGCWLGFDNTNAVADLGFTLFVMHVVFLRTFHDLVETCVRNACDVFDNDSLVHFIGDDHANAGFTKMNFGFLRGIAHDEIKVALG